MKYTLPAILEGFASVDEFIKLAHSVSNRRKSRAGASLEHHLASIFIDEQLQFEQQIMTEGRKQPDFLFPSSQAYHNKIFPPADLSMLAAKTCCKDRCRQVITEAQRITPKHLFTLQEGISSPQLQEMRDSQVQLVIPASNLSKYPSKRQHEIMTLEQFIIHIKAKQSSVS